MASVVCDVGGMTERRGGKVAGKNSIPKPLLGGALAVAALSLPAPAVAELKPQVMEEMASVAESCGQLTAKVERCFEELGYQSTFVKSGFLKWARSKGAGKDDLDALSVRFERGLMRGERVRCESLDSAERAAKLAKMDEIVGNCSRPRR